MKIDKGELAHITQAHLVGYRINNGNLSNMTPLQNNINYTNLNAAYTINFFRNSEMENQQQTFRDNLKGSHRKV